MLRQPERDLWEMFRARSEDLELDKAVELFFGLLAYGFVEQEYLDGEIIIREEPASMAESAQSWSAVIGVEPSAFPPSTDIDVPPSVSKIKSKPSETVSINLKPQLDRQVKEVDAE